MGSELARDATVQDLLPANPDRVLALLHERSYTRAHGRELRELADLFMSDLPTALSLTVMPRRQDVLPELAMGMLEGRRRSCSVGVVDHYAAQWRVRALNAPSRRWSLPDGAAQSARAEIARQGSLSGSSLALIVDLAVEIGRFSAALAPSSDAGNYGIRSPESTPAVDVLDVLLERGLDREPLVTFDKREHRYVEVPVEQLAKEASSAAKSSFAAEVRAFFALYTPATSESDRASSTRARTRFAELSRMALSEHYGPLARAFAEQQHASASYEGFGDAPRPQPQQYGVTPSGAEHWVRDAVRWLGAAEAEVTPVSGDGGVDVATERFAISVKHYAGSVPVEEVREIFAVAITQGKSAMLWTSGKLTKAGIEFARVAPVHVVHYDVSDASIAPLTSDTDALLRSGLHRARS